MCKFYFLLPLVVLLTVRCQQDHRPTKSSSKKLLVGIVVDQMRYDYLTRYSDDYGSNGWKRLQQGHNYTQHHFSYMPTATGPGHASVFTGATPRTHGIIGNNWPLEPGNGSMYCVQDDAHVSVGKVDEEGNRSPKNLQHPSLGDYVKQTFGGKVYGVSIKDRGAILPAGKMADAAYWLSADSTISFITSTYYADSLPTWVNDFETQQKADALLRQGWTTFIPVDSMKNSGPDFRNREHSIALNGQPVFPYNLEEIKVKKGYGVIKYTPHGNTLLAEFAKALIMYEELGQDTVLDFLSVSFSSPDYIGHSYGPNSKEIHDMYVKLDTTIASFLQFLDRQVGEDNYLVFLTADHGAAPIPDESIAPYYSNKKLLKYVNETIQEKTGMDSAFYAIDNYQLFLNKQMITTQGFAELEVLQWAKEALLTQMGIDTVYVHTEIDTLAPQGSEGWFLANGWHADLSGQLLFVPQKGWLPSGYEKRGGTGHGTLWQYDTHVPFLIYGTGIPAEVVNDTHWVHQIVPDIQSFLTHP